MKWDIPRGIIEITPHLHIDAGTLELWNVYPVQFTCQSCGAVKIFKERSVEDSFLAAKEDGWLTEDRDVGLECGECRSDPYRRFQTITLV